MNTATKTTKNTIIWIMLIASFTSCSPAAEKSDKVNNIEKIEGAFGVRLGDVTKLQVNGNPKDVSFVPDNPSPWLTIYTLNATPRTGQIYEIVCKGFFNDSTKAKEVENKIQQMLIAKYGTNRGGLMLFGGLEIKQGDRTVSIHQGLKILSDTSEVIVTYTDDRLKAIATKEREEEQRKRDSGGF
jgi:hypothetical protein